MRSTGPPARPARGGAGRGHRSSMAAFRSVVPHLRGSGSSSSLRVARPGAAWVSAGGHA
jgi:hypothetical protein